MAICLGGKKMRKTGQEVNDIINLNISAACRISFVWSCLFVLITSLYGLVSKKKHGNYLQCGTESIPTQADDCGPGGLSSQESQPYLTTTYSTIPNQRYCDNWHALPHKCHTMPHNAMPFHAMQYHTVQRSRCLSHPVPSHKKSFSPCRFFYVSPLDLFPSKISFFACVICGFFCWTT